MALHITIGGRYDKPSILCDGCGAAITAAADGQFQWRQSASGTTDGTIYFTHTRCGHVFEHSQGGAWSASPLDWLLVFLMNTLQVDRQHTEARIMEASMQGSSRF